MPEVVREAPRAETLLAARVPEFLRKPVAVLQTRVDAIEVEARRGLGGLLESGHEGLHEVEQFLERMSRQDWSVTGMRRRLHALRSRAGDARETALRRVDTLPGAAVTALANAGRARVRDLSRGLHRMAKRVAPTPAPAMPAAASSGPPAARRHVNGV